MLQMLIVTLFYNKGYYHFNYKVPQPLRVAEANQLNAWHICHLDCLWVRFGRRHGPF